MDDNRQYEIIEKILLSAGITSRDILVERYDKHAGIEGIKAIGPRRRKLIAHALSSTEAWLAAFPNLPVHEEGTPIAENPLDYAGDLQGT